MRVVSRKLSPDDILAITTVKEAGNDFAAVLKRFVAPSRELSVALTEAETAVMWATKGITK